MKVLNADVYMHDSSDNDGDLRLLVDHIPNDLVYIAKPTSERSTFYYACKEGYVSFMHSTPDKRGYGGAISHLHLEDGTEVDVKGPWSASSGAAHRLGFPACIEVAITEDPEVFKKGYTYSAGAVLSIIAIDAVKEFCPQFQVFDTMKWGTDFYLSFQRTEKELCRFIDEQAKTVLLELLNVNIPLKTYNRIDTIMRAARKHLRALEESIETS